MYEKYVLNSQELEVPLLWISDFKVVIILKYNVLYCLMLCYHDHNLYFLSNKLNSSTNFNVRIFAQTYYYLILFSFYVE